MRTYNPDATCPKCDSADIATRSHTCVHSEVVYWRDGWRICRDGWRIYQFYDNCLTCGRSLAAPWLNRCPPHRVLGDTCVKCGRTVTGR